MANITIDALPTLSVMTSTTAIPVDQTEVTYQLSGANLKSFVLAAVPGANVTGTVPSATVAASANAVTGANVSGQVANALVAGTVYTAAQPNITSVGTLASLGVTGAVTAADFIGGGTQLTGVPVKVTGSWTVTSGTNNYSFTVTSGSYQMWVLCNIPNGIISWFATVNVTNTNVGALGVQYAWNYTGGGTPISITSIPNQIIGTAGTISTDATYLGTTANVFEFGINNTSGTNQTVNWGYIKIS